MVDIKRDNSGSRYLGIYMDPCADDRDYRHDEDLKQIGRELQVAGIPVGLGRELYSLEEYRELLDKRSGIKGLPGFSEGVLTARFVARFLKEKEYDPRTEIHYRPETEFDGLITLRPMIVYPNPMYKEGERFARFEEIYYGGRL